MCRQAPSPASKGVKIVFSDGSGANKTLYYFSTNLADDSIGRTGFLQFCAKLGPADSFIKSASYLLQTGRFNKVRNFLLEQSATILQDDTGIPIAYFNPKVWRFQAFGRYVGPLNISGATYQARMGELFRNAIPIDFGVGYRWRINELNLVLAQKVASGSNNSALAPPLPSDQYPQNAGGSHKQRPPGKRAESEPKAEPRRECWAAGFPEFSRFVLIPRPKPASNASKWGHSRRGDWALVGERGHCLLRSEDQSCRRCSRPPVGPVVVVRARHFASDSKARRLEHPAPRIAPAPKSRQGSQHQATSRPSHSRQSRSSKLEQRITLLRGRLQHNLLHVSAALFLVGCAGWCWLIYNHFASPVLVEPAEAAYTVASKADTEVGKSNSFGMSSYRAHRSSAGPDSQQLSRQR